MRLRRRQVEYQRLSRRALRLLIVPICLLSLSAVLPTFLMRRSAGPDLFDLTPASPRVDGYLLVAWHELERGYQSLKNGEGLFPGAPARALGYMSEGSEHVNAGQSIRQFILLPDSGGSGDSGQRFGDRMIEVHLQEGKEIRFAPGALVWVRGAWKPLPGNPNGDRPLYVLTEATAESASTTEIAKYFH